MLKKRKIYRVLLTTLWLIAGVATCVVLVAAARSQEGKKCAGVLVHIRGVNGVAYVSKKQIVNIISGNRPQILEGKLIADFDLEKAEEKLEQNLWIRNAELFFDNHQVLQVEVTEREPVARIFTVSGQSFYVDETAECLPLSNEQVARVPVFTSFPADVYHMRKADSAMLLQVRDMGDFILRNKFWMAQVEQVDIVDTGFELVPKLGNHIVYFGDASQMEAKFNRLRLFYSNIMRNSGWNYYSRLDLSFDKLLVATRRDSTSLFQSFVLPSRDSILISNTIDSSKLRFDSAYMQQPLHRSSDEVKQQEKISPFGNATFSNNKKSVPNGALPEKPSTAAKSNALKNQIPTPSNTNVKPPAGQPNENKPKAVMPKRSNNR